MSNTRDNVEAVLLNSEGDPRLETYLALQAVARFALIELGCSEAQFMKAAAAAFELVNQP